jgi:protein-S-isoprenylcysteine O-methyltransferase Ste14
MNRKKIVPVVVAGLVSGLLTGAVMLRLTSRSHSDAPAKLEMLHIFPSVALWLIFFGYWGIAGRNAAPTESSESAGSTQFHQVALGLTLLLLILPFPGLTARYLPDSNLTLALGLMIQAGFILLAVWARRHLGRNWSAEVRIAVDHQLVRTGPYRTIRHPIYTAILGMFVGTAVASGEIHSVVALIIMAALYVRKTRLEEQILGKTFGTEYDNYRRDSWALVPLVF